MLQAMTAHVDTAEGQGSGWKFHRLIQLTFTAAYGPHRFGLARAVIGGKRAQIESSTDDENSDNNIMWKKSKKKIAAEAKKRIAKTPKKRTPSKKFTSQEFVLDECDASSDSDNEAVAEETAEDRALIDDRKVAEEYQPFNYNNNDAAITPNDEEMESELEDEVEMFVNTSPDKLKELEEILAEDDDLMLDSSAPEKEQMINLNTGVNLSKISLTAATIKKLKNKVERGIDSSTKPDGECTYFSLLRSLKFLKKAKSVDKYKRKRTRRRCLEDLGLSPFLNKTSWKRGEGNFGGDMKIDIFVGQTERP